MPVRSPVLEIGSNDYLESPHFSPREYAAVLWAEHVIRNTARDRDDVYDEVGRQFSVHILFFVPVSQVLTNGIAGTAGFDTLGDDLHQSASSSSHVLDCGSERCA